jgi:hypothetical protein
MYFSPQKNSRAKVALSRSSQLAHLTERALHNITALLLPFLQIIKQSCTLWTLMAHEGRAHLACIVCIVLYMYN